MADLRPLHDWSGAPASLTVWRPSAGSLEAARQAPVSAVPPSHEQEQHLRAFLACRLRQEDMARLLIMVWEEPGRCDLRAMTHVLNAHLRRHETYHSWFEEGGDTIVRHVLAEPSALQLEPVMVGEVNAEQWQRHVMATPGPFAWDCFRFGILQRAGGFTCFASIDHLHADSTAIAFLMDEIHAAYRAVIDGDIRPRLGQAGSYLEYCSGQRRRATAMTLEDPEVAEWVAFLHRNHGRMPPFPLPLGVQDDRCLSAYLRADILDGAAMAIFEEACHAAGARVIGGLLACAALTERELTGASRYCVVTPTTTRKTAEDFRMMGWCMGVVPVDFDVGGLAFSDVAAAAQRTFDHRLGLAQIPIERVLELAAGLPTIRPAATGGVMLSYMDTSLPPLNAHIARDWHAASGKVYINQGVASQVALWFFRTPNGLTLTAGYPDNPTAHHSMERYVSALRDTCRALRPARAGTGA